MSGRGDSAKQSSARRDTYIDCTVIHNVRTKIQQEEEGLHGATSSLHKDTTVDFIENTADHVCIHNRCRNLMKSFIILYRPEIATSFRHRFLVNILSSPEQCGAAQLIRKWCYWQSAACIHIW